MNKSSNVHVCPRVVTYINIRLSSLYFSLCKDIFFHRDISIVFLFINNSTFFLINIYSDSSHSALKYLKDTGVDITNVLVMADDFNIRNSFWNLMYSLHSYSDLLLNITDSLSLGLSYLTNPVPTRYSDNNQNLNSVIDLMFLRYSTVELDNHTIHLEWRLSLDHAPLTVTILIEHQHMNNCIQSIPKGSKEEKLFIKDLIKDISSINTSNISDIYSLGNAINSFPSIVKRSWEKNSKIVNILKHSKSW